VQIRVTREQRSGRYPELNFAAVETRQEPEILKASPRRGTRDCQARGRLRNFSRNRPEATNLNHQKASLRIFIGLTHTA
jgi:hypothetical protein